MVTIRTSILLRVAWSYHVMHTMCKDVLNPLWNLYRSLSFNGCYRFQHILCSIFYDSSLLYPIFLLSKGLAKEAKRRIFFFFWHYFFVCSFKKCLALHISLSQLGEKKFRTPGSWNPCHMKPKNMRKTSLWINEKLFQQFHKINNIHLYLTAHEYDCIFITFHAIKTAYKFR